jgi:hypothetical protein
LDIGADLRGKSARRGSVLSLGAFSSESLPRTRSGVEIGSRQENGVKSRI